MAGVQTVAIDSLEDPRVAAFRDLQDAHARDRDGLFIVEGRDNVRRLLSQRRFRVRALLVTPTALEALRDLLDAPHIAPPVLLASIETLREVVGFDLHRGCVALGERGEALTVEALAATRGRSLLLAFDHVNNPDNVGGIFRNAMAFGATGVLLCPRSGDPLYRKAIRVSMGGSLIVPFARCASFDRTLDELRCAGHELVALHPGAAGLALGAESEALRKSRRLVLVFGSEGSGIGANTLARCTAALAIPMAAGVDSLNVATASGIALHHFANAGAA